MRTDVNVAYDLPEKEKQDLSRKCSALKDFRLSFQLLSFPKILVPKKFRSIEMYIFVQKKYWVQKFFLFGLIFFSKVNISNLLPSLLPCLEVL